MPEQYKMLVSEENFMSPEQGLNRLAAGININKGIYRVRLLEGRLTRRLLKKSGDLNEEEMDMILQAQRYFFKEKKRRGDELVASMGDALDAIRTGLPLPFTIQKPKN